MDLKLQFHLDMASPCSGMPICVPSRLSDISSRLPQKQCWCWPGLTQIFVRRLESRPLHFFIPFVFSWRLLPWSALSLHKNQAMNAVMVWLVLAQKSDDDCFHDLLCPCTEIRRWLLSWSALYLNRNQTVNTCDDLLCPCTEIRRWILWWSALSLHRNQTMNVVMVYFVLAQKSDDECCDGLLCPCTEIRRWMSWWSTLSLHRNQTTNTVMVCFVFAQKLDDEYCGDVLCPCIEIRRWILWWCTLSLHRNQMMNAVMICFHRIQKTIAEVFLVLT